MVFTPEHYRTGRCPGVPSWRKVGWVKVRRFGEQGKGPAHKEPEPGPPLQAGMMGVVWRGQGWPDQVGGKRVGGVNGEAGKEEN